MAKVIINSKGFKVLEVSFDDCVKKIGGLGICDSCNERFENAFYVAVLNYCMCQKCYDKWAEQAVFYSEDITVETRNFEKMQKILTKSILDELISDFFKNIPSRIGRDKIEFIEGIFVAALGIYMMNENRLLRENGPQWLSKRRHKLLEEIDSYIENEKLKFKF